jgi:hypothetical protein
LARLKVTIEHQVIMNSNIIILLFQAYPQDNLLTARETYCNLLDPLTFNMNMRDYMKLLLCNLSQNEFVFHLQSCKPCEVVIDRSQGLFRPLSNLFPSQLIHLDRLIKQVVLNFFHSHEVK